MLIAGVLAGTLVGGCRVSRPNPDHCYYAEGDLTCAQLDSSRPFCAAPECSVEPFGCVAELPTDACYSACGGGVVVEDDPSCLGVADESETSSGSETETGSGTGSEAEECVSHDECPEDAPFCLAGSCVPCDGAPEPDEACFTLTQGQATICLEGSCVECTPDDLSACIDAALACDVETNACVPCTTHEQCPGGAACDLVMGACLPPDKVFHVDGDGGGDFETIVDAMAAIGEGGSGTLIIHELDTPGYAEGLSVSGDRAIAVFGANDELPLLADAPVSIEALDGARMYARRLILNGDDAVRIVDGHVELDAVQVAPTLMHAVLLDGGSLELRNGMLRSALTAAPVIQLSGVAEIDVRYSTLVGMGAVAIVDCQGATVVPGSRIRNSILVNFGDEPPVQCGTPAYEHNGLEDAAGFEGNTTLGDVQPGWFIDALLADLHLGLAAPLGLASAGVWSEGDPVVDFDGDPRPAVEGSVDVIGADRLP